MNDMNTRFLARGLLVSLVVLVGCTQSKTANTDPEASRRMITGSHVPQPVDRPTFGNVSANVPVGSASRKPDSLVPSEPTVGAGGQSDYRLDEPSTGAAPEGVPSVRKGEDRPVPKPTPLPGSKSKPKATPTPTPN